MAKLGLVWLCTTGGDFLLWKVMGVIKNETKFTPLGLGLLCIIIKCIFECY